VLDRVINERSADQGRIGTGEAFHGEKDHC
jgi:hypothetical protein